MKSTSLNIALLCVAAVATAHASVGGATFQQVGDIVVMSNANVVVQYDLTAGTADFYWQNSKKIAAFYSGAGLNSGYVKGITYTSRTWSMDASNEAAIVSTGSPLTTAVMKQYFTLDQSNSFLVRLEMDGANVSANWMGPLVLDTPGGMDVGTYGDNRALFVPYDNDGYVRYNAEAMNGSDTGYEAGAFYDNVSRNGLVVGSVTHDTWKTGVYWSGSNNRLDKLNVFGGVTSHWTWDVMKHGFVTGNSVSSPTVYVGFGPDWRSMLEAYADENTLFAPKLAWTGGVPFGWNSWGYYQTHISYTRSINVSDSLHTNLQARGFTNNGTLYVNLDSYWDNMNDTQLTLFANHCHANGQKAGIYWTPFVWWGNSANASNSVVEGTSYHYSDALLRDDQGRFQTNDSALAMDLSHPAMNQRIDYYLARFFNEGFDYIKLDFLSHGAMEGVHYDPAITTGMQAYNEGMQYLLSKLNGRMFINESIAPLFPYQYAHSRRIACDGNNSRISDVEYTMNSVGYGWWLDRLYTFNDPDIMVFSNGASLYENQSRVISGAVTGVFLNGDSLTNAATISAAQRSLTNAAINAVAASGQTFEALDGNTASAAPTVLTKQSGSARYVAAFNYGASPLTRTIDLARAGAGLAGYNATDLWDGSAWLVTNTLSVPLNAKQARLIRLDPILNPATFSRIAVSDSTVTLQGAGGAAYTTYRALAATNLFSPASNWAQIGAGSFDPNGAFILSITNQPAASQQFFRLQSP